MVGMALAKSIYAVPTWTRLVALVTEHPALRAAISGGTPVPSVYACYRFTAKLRIYGDMLTGCIDRVTAGLSAQLPESGRNIAIDGSDMPAYANGQRFVSKNGRERAADELRRPGRLLGSPLRSLDAQGRRVLRLQDRRDGLHRHRPSHRLERPHRPRSRAGTRPRANRHGQGARARGRDSRDGQGVRRPPHLRGLRGPRRAADHHTHQVPRRQARRPPHPDVRARRVAVRGARTMAARRPSGGARPASASPPQSGSRPTACSR